MDFKSEVSVYSQIIDYLKKEIFCGALGCGQRIPPIRELAVSLKVNHNTIVRSYAELEAEGYIYTSSTNGKFVTDDLVFLNDKRRRYVAGEVSELIKNAKHIGLEKSELLKVLEDEYEK